MRAVSNDDQEAYMRPLPLPSPARWLAPIVCSQGSAFSGVVKSVTSYFKRSRSKSTRSRSSSRKKGFSSAADAASADATLQASDNASLGFLVKFQASCHALESAQSGSPVQISYYWMNAICSASEEWFSDARYLRVTESLFSAAFSCMNAQMLMSRIVYGALARVLSDACANPGAKEPLLAMVPGWGGGLFRSAGQSPIYKCPFLAFEAMLCETLAEKPLWDIAGDVLGRPESRGVDIAKLKLIIAAEGNEAMSRIGGSPYALGHNNTRDLADYRIYKWARLALTCDASSPVIALTWQAFLCLYFSRSCNHPDVCFGSIFLSSKKRGRKELGKELKARSEVLAGRYQEFAETSDAASPAVQTYRRMAAFLLRCLWLALDIDLGGVDASTPCLHRLAHLIHRPLFGDKSKMYRKNLWYDLVPGSSFDPVHALASEAAAWMPCRSSSAVSDDARAIRALRRRASVMNFGFHPLVEPPSKMDIDVAASPLDVRRIVTSGRHELTALGSSLEPLIVASRRHAEEVSHHCALNQQVLELLPSLYRKEARVVQEERIFEKKMYHFEFRFLESIFDENMFQTITEMRSQSFLGKCQDLASMQPLLVAVARLRGQSRAFVHATATLICRLM